jgi:nicotinamide phosphoribosyltransferase
MTNPILNVDSYKHSHFLQYPHGTTEVYSYIESRGGEFGKFVFFGLQAYLKKSLSRVPTLDEIDQAEKIVVAHGLPFNRQGWVDLHILGYWPVEIKALPEGMVVPTHVPCVTICNTDPRFYWITSFLETALLRAVWYPSTVATISYNAKKIISKYLEETCDVPDWKTNILPFRLHDFGARGVSSEESAALGGLGHLVNFMGTDTMSALIAAMEFYNAKDVVGYSIPAAEHSTITSWGESGEPDAYQNMITQFGGGLYAVVSDSYDLDFAVRSIWGEELRHDVLDAKGTLVVRPDSGDPATIVVNTLNILGTKFDYTTNSKGYMVLNPKVRVIQGDGINLKSIPQILEAVKQSGWSTENLAMGMGGMLLQGCNRDTLKWAMKASSVTINGNEKGVNKNPKTDPGKASKKGKFSVVAENGTLVCKPRNGFAAWDTMQTVYRDGKLLVDWTFDDVRSFANR